MTSEQEGLLATIAARPDDDLPRLVYADWLDDHGQTGADRTQASFIRRKIAEWRDPTPWEASPGGRKSAKLLKRFQEAWLAGLPPFQAVAGIQFERGFPEKVYLRPDAADAVPLLERLPHLLGTVTRLELMNAYYARWADGERLARADGLRQIRALTTGDTAGAAVAALLASEHLVALDELALHRADPADLRATAGDCPAARPRVVAWPVQVLDDPRDCPWLCAATDLTLTGWVAGQDGGWLARIARDRLARAESLELVGDMGFGFDGQDAVRALAAPRLRCLTFRNGDYHDDGPVDAADDDGLVAALAEHPGLPALESLDLSHLSIRPQTAVRLLESAAFPALADVSLVSEQPPNVLYDYLRTADRPLCLRRVWVCVGWGQTHYNRPLRDRLGDRLQPHSLAQLARTRRRLGIQ